MKLTISYAHGTARPWHVCLERDGDMVVRFESIASNALRWIGKWMALLESGR